MNEKGYLMIEVLFISLLLTVLVSIIGIYIVGNNMVVASANTTTAGFLAQKQMACVKSNPKVCTLDFSGYIEWQDTNDSLPLIKNGTVFKVVTKIENVKKNDYLKHILVTVTWEEYHMPKKLVLNTLVLVDE